jgi:hypothetical protein
MKKLLTEKFSIRILITGIIIIFLGLFIFSWNNWNFSKFGEIELERLSQFSDFIGGLVGPIFALVGVILFYIALTEQRKDFATNREALQSQTKALEQQIVEFELQRQELSETRQVFKIQTETFRKQQFESTFFNLLNLHHQIVNSIDVSRRERKYPGFESVFNKNIDRSEKITVVTTGRDCFIIFGNEYRKKYTEFKNENPEMEELVLVKKSYWNFYEEYQSDLGHYFRNLYHIFKFINNSDEPNKNIYTSLVRAQLSNDELFLLFYNSASDLGNEKFLPLIEEYHLLQNLNTDNLINLEKHYGFFKKGAY